MNRRKVPSLALGFGAGATATMSEDVVCTAPAGSIIFFASTDQPGGKEVSKSGGSR